MGEGDFVQRVVWPTCRLVLHLLQIVYTASLPHGNSRAARGIVQRRRARAEILFKVPSDVDGRDDS